MQKIELKDSERTRCEIWSRVMGYHRPVKAWNIGKQQEYADRALFKEPTTLPPSKHKKTPPAVSPCLSEGDTP